MGIFDKAIKKGLGDAIGGALGNKLIQAVEQATGVDLNSNGRAGNTPSPFGSTTQTYSAPGQQGASYSAPFPAPAAPTARVTEKSFFRDIIHEHFGNYIVREDVAVSELGGEGKPYDFALINHGECCGVVMLVAHNRDNNRAYKGARAAAEANGVPFINFYTHMTNEYEYVVNRIKRLVKP